MDDRIVRRNNVAQCEVQVINSLGLHLRAAERFARLAQTFEARIEVARDGVSANGKSILDLTCLAAAQGSSIRIQAEGADAVEAIVALVELVSAGFLETAAS